MTLSYTLKSTAAQMLPALVGLLKKAAMHFEEKGVDESVWLGARLAPDMHPLTRQVQMACDGVVRPSARLSGVDMPSFPDTETTVAELIDRIERSAAFVAGTDAAAMDANEDATLTIPLGPMTAEWQGGFYVTAMVIPNFMFHVTTTYALLRMQGVEVGKRDYLGL